MKSKLLLLVLVVSVLFASSAFVSAQETEGGSGILCNCSDCDDYKCPTPKFDTVPIDVTQKGGYEKNCNGIEPAWIRIEACVKQWAWAYIPGTEVLLDISKPGTFNGLLLNICTDSNDSFGIRFGEVYPHAIGDLYKDLNFSKPKIAMLYNLKMCRPSTMFCWETGWKTGTDLRNKDFMTGQKCSHLFRLYGKFTVDSKIDPGCYKRIFPIFFVYKSGCYNMGTMTVSEGEGATAGTMPD